MPTGGGGSIHHVASGDTLSSISRRYGIGLDRIIAANPGLDPHRIRIGQPIVVPKAGGGAPVQQKRHDIPAPATTGVYTVRAGDTLSSIARRHSTTATQLMAMNQLRNPNALSIGQRLNVPGATAGGQQQPPAAEPQPLRWRLDVPEADPRRPPRSRRTRAISSPPLTATVTTRWSAKTRFTPSRSRSAPRPRELRALNDLKGDDELSVGQYLLVPVTDPSLYES